MSNLIYNATFPRRALGLDVVITDKAGATVTIEEDPTLVLTAANGNTYIQVSLPEADAPYSAACSSARLGAFSTDMTVALADSIADAPGASETAYLIATAVAGDTGDGEVTIDLVADPAHGDLPSWVTVVAGDAVLGAEAGGCFASLIGKVDFDFTGTTAPDDPGYSRGVFTIKQDGSQIDSEVVDQTGDGENAQTTEMVVPVGGFVLGGTISATVNAVAFTTAGEGDPVSPDAATAITLAVNITRVAPAPTLP